MPGLKPDIASPATGAVNLPDRSICESRAMTMLDIDLNLGIDVFDFLRGEPAEALRRIWWRVCPRPPHAECKAYSLAPKAGWKVTVPHGQCPSNDRARKYCGGTPAWVSWSRFLKPNLT